MSHSREPVHPADTRPHPGLSLSWRLRRRELAAGCRYWATQPPEVGGDSRLAVAADCLEDERDLVVAFKPLAGWFRMNPHHVALWSVSEMLERVRAPRRVLDRNDPYVTLRPCWSKIPVHASPREAMYPVDFKEGPAVLTMLWEEGTGDPLAGLTWHRAGESGVVAVRTSVKHLRAERAAWWDWLFLRAACLHFQANGQTVPVRHTDFLVLPGLPWSTA